MVHSIIANAVGGPHTAGDHSRHCIPMCEMYVFCYLSSHVFVWRQTCYVLAFLWMYCLLLMYTYSMCM